GVHVFPKVRAGVVTEVVELLPGYAWKQGYATAGTLNLVEKQNEDAGGTFHNTEVSGFAPGERDQLLNLFDNMSGNPFLVILKDNLGVKRLVGDPVNHLIFTSDFS